jgi:hypothetical protein
MVRRMAVILPSGSGNHSCPDSPAIPLSVGRGPSPFWRMLGLIGGRSRSLEVERAR